MRCPNCGMDVADAGRFCENCGAPLAGAQAASQVSQAQVAADPIVDPAIDPIGQTGQPGWQAGTQPYAQADARAYDSRQTQEFGQQGASSYAPYGNQPGSQAGEAGQTGQSGWQAGPSGQASSYAPPQPATAMPMGGAGSAKQASNAPFVLAIIALVTAILGLFPVSLVLAIIALATNSGQKKRGETSTKQTPTFVMGLISLILSILMGILTLLVGGAVWLAFVNGDLDELDDIVELVEADEPSSHRISEVAVTSGSSSAAASSSSASSAAAADIVGTWEIESMVFEGQTYDMDYLDMLRGLGMKIDLVASADGTAALEVLDEVETGTWTDNGGGSFTFTFDGESMSGTLSGDVLELADDEDAIVFHRADSASSSTASSSAGEQASSASSAASGDQYADVGRPTVGEFDWAASVRNGRLPDGAEMLVTNTEINGDWKAFAEYMDYDGSVVVTELLNIEIQAGDRAASVTFDWYQINYGEGYTTESQDPVTLDGAFDPGSVSVYGSYGNAEFNTFYELGGKQYGLGSMMLPSGEMVNLSLVRP